MYTKVAFSAVKLQAAFFFQPSFESMKYWKATETTCYDAIGRWQSVDPTTQVYANVNSLKRVSAGQPAFMTAFPKPATEDSDESA